MLVLENMEHENYVNTLCLTPLPVMCSPEELLQNNEDN
jgi:hypothetical protein